MSRASLVVAAVVAVGGCSVSIHGAALPERPVGEDLVALLPSGADGVVDLEVSQLGNWPPARQLLALLPPAGKERVARLGADPLSDVEALAVALVKPGSPESESTIVARGTLDFDKLRATLDGGHEVDYHGARIFETDGDAMARVTPSVYAFGSRVAVRRVVDVAHKDDEGLRVSAGDKALRDALARAPTAKLGRPALLAALMMTPALREKLRHDDWRQAAELDWIALSFAVGDGFDVGIVGGAPSPIAAQDLAATLKSRSQALTQQRTIRLLGLLPYVEPFIVVAHESEVHMAYRLSEPRLEALIERLRQMQSLAPQSQAAPPPQSRSQSQSPSQSSALPSSQSSALPSSPEGAR